MTTAIEYALMAGHAYRTTRDEINWIPAPQGWTPFFPVPDPTTASVFPVAAGFEAVSFQRGTEIVISYAGTGPGLNVDWVANSQLALGAWSDQLGEAAAYYLQVKAANTINGVAPNITFTGHSLGGGLAALMSVFFGGTVMTFDQAPFAASATTAMRDQLVTYLEQHGYNAQQLADLAPALVAPDFNPAVGALNVTGISVSGEALSLGNRLRIGLQVAPIEHAPDNWFLSSIDMHSQALLTAFLQSDQTAAAGQALDDVTYKLTDLLGMIFDGKLFAHPADDPKNENLLERLVKHESGVQGSITADAMLTRFTSDLWKIAQDGGLTLTDPILSRALTAFAMQMYYEDTANATNKDKELFTTENITGGIRFDIFDVSKTFQAAFDSTGKIDLDDAKGYKEYFAKYLSDDPHTFFTSEELGQIKSWLPYMRDWYVQAGSDGMNATDTQNRGAFMLGGNGADQLTGGTADDLLVGNAVNDAHYATQPEWRAAA